MEKKRDIIQLSDLVILFISYYLSYGLSEILYGKYSDQIIALRYSSLNYIDAMTKAMSYSRLISFSILLCVLWIIRAVVLCIIFPNSKTDIIKFSIKLLLIYIIGNVIIMCFNLANTVLLIYLAVCFLGSIYILYSQLRRKSNSSNSSESKQIADENATIGEEYEK